MLFRTSSNAIKFSQEAGREPRCVAYGAIKAMIPALAYMSFLSSDGSSLSREQQVAPTFRLVMMAIIQLIERSEWTATISPGLMTFERCSASKLAAWSKSACQETGLLSKRQNCS